VGKFHQKHGEGTLWGNMKFQQYFVEGKFIRNPRRAKDAERLRETRKLFEQYGAQYSLDWVTGRRRRPFRESGLDNQKKSPVGAVGIMQVMPCDRARSARARDRTSSSSIATSKPVRNICD
jgi:membrane-bound lytic murein transglycosylase MltF